MRIFLKSRIAALIITVLLVAVSSPAAYAAKLTGKITVEKSSVKLSVDQSVTLALTYDDVEDSDIFRARVYCDKDGVADVNFGNGGSDLSSVTITGLADGMTTVYVSAGRVRGQCTVTVGRGDKSPEQAKKEETAKKADENLIANDNSALGAALAEAVKKETKKEVVISTTSDQDPAIPVSTLKALAARAGQAKKSVIVRVDSLDSNGKVYARLFADPASLTALKSEFKTGVTIDTSRKASLGGNYIASVKCAHAGSFGSFTEIAVKVSTPKDVSKLSVYNVDSSGKLKKIDEPSCFLDKNGFLHLYTKNGGEIVIVNGDLK